MNTVAAAGGFAVAGVGNLASVVEQINPPDGQGGFQFDTVTPFLNLGLIGVLFLMFIARKGIVPEWVLKQAEDRHERELAAKEADVQEMKRLLAESTKNFNDQVIPAFTRSIDVNREYVELLRGQQNQPPRAPRRRANGD